VITMDLTLLLEHPFDLSLAAPQLEDSDCPHQSDLIEAATTSTAFAQQRLDSNFFIQPCTSLSLSVMEKIYNKQDRQAAITMLGKRHKIDWTTSEYHVLNTNPMLTWNADQNYIDMLVCVSTNIGLSILLPTQRDHTYNVKFDFRNRYRPFSAKFAKLGFDAKSSFLWVGKSTSHEDIFIAWAPSESLTNEGEEVEVGLCTGNTQLSAEHFRLTVMFFAFVMEKLGHRGLWVSTKYPALDEKSKPEFDNASNIQ
jgi:hypothetical protein